MIPAAAFAQLCSPRAVAFGLAGALATAFLIAIPTAVLENPFFVRMTPVRPLDYLFLALTALGVGILAATYAIPAPENVERRTLAGGFLAFLAIGCPICNKVVVLLLGISGALSYFEPIQPLLGIASAVLLGTAIVTRLRSLGSCAVRRIQVA